MNHARAARSGGCRWSLSSRGSCLIRVDGHHAMKSAISICAVNDNSYRAASGTIAESCGTTTYGSHINIKRAISQLKSVWASDNSFSSGSFYD